VTYVAVSQCQSHTLHRTNPYRYKFKKLAQNLPAITTSTNKSSAIAEKTCHASVDKMVIIDANRVK